MLTNDLKPGLSGPGFILNTMILIDRKRINNYK